MNAEYKSLSDFKKLLIVFVISFFLLIPLYRYHRIYSDEGELIVGAMRVVNGQVIYRDFFKFLPPGSYYLMGALFYIFGMNINTTVITAIVTFSLIAVVLFWHIRYLTESLFFSIFALAFFISIGTFWFMASHHWFSTLSGMLALLFFVKFLDNPDQKIFLFLSGVAIGLTTNFTHNKGIILYFMFTGLILLKLLFQQSTGRALSFLKSTGILTFGSIIPIIPFMIYLLVKGAMKECIYDLFAWVIRGYYSFNKYPYYFFSEINLMKSIFAKYDFFSALFQIRSFLIVGITPIIGIIVTLFIAINDFTKQKRNPFIELSYSLCGASFLISVWQRADFAHILFTMPLNFSLFLFVIWRIINYLSNRGLNKLKTIIFALLIFFVIDLVILYILSVKRIYSKNTLPIKTPAGILWTTSGAIEAHRNQELYDFFTHLQLKNGELFVYSSIPDIYFYLKQMPPTPYDQIIPGYNTEEQLLEVVSILQEKKPKYIIKDFFIEDIIKDRNKAGYPMADLDAFINDPISTYIRDNYKALPAETKFRIFVRKQ